MDVALIIKISLIGIISIIGIIGIIVATAATLSIKERTWFDIAGGTTMAVLIIAFVILISLAILNS